MNTFNRKFLKVFLFLLPLYIGLILITEIKINAYAYYPGNLTDVADEVQIDGYDQKLNGSVSTVYVLSVYKPTILEYCMASILPYNQTYRLSNESSSSVDTALSSAIGVFDNDRSFSAAQLAAFDALGGEVAFTYIPLTYIYSANKTINANMKYTDIVGKKVKTIENSNSLYPKMSVVSDYLSSKAVGETAYMTLEDKDGKTYDFTIKKGDNGLFGITILASYIVTSGPTVSVKSTSAQGPSGGAMEALLIYLLISNKDYLKGRKIAGTGTIDAKYDSEGNVTTFGYVGAIGCVEQKIYAAYLDHASIFYCPESNYDDALVAYKNYGFTEAKIRLVKVATLNDILVDLEATGND